MNLPDKNKPSEQKNRALLDNGSLLEKNKPLPVVYSDDSFWEKLKDYAKIAGRETVELALKLYYCLQDNDTPTWAKTVIGGALVYFIIPVDAVPDFLPGGYIDDLGALASALLAVSSHIKEAHAQRAQKKLQQWFGLDDVPPDT